MYKEHVRTWHWDDYSKIHFGVMNTVGAFTIKPKIDHGYALQNILDIYGR